MKKLAAIASLSLVVSLVGCGSDGGGSGDEGGDGAGGADGGPGDIGPVSVTVSGSVIDFETGAPLVDVDPDVTTLGLAPDPTVTMDGADFVLTNVAANSTFHLLAHAAGHRTTVAAAVTVVDSDLDGVVASVVSEAYVSALADAFAVDAGVAGIVLVRAVDDTGAPRAGIPAAAFELLRDEPVAGPFFLGEDLLAAPDLEATSASGWVVFFQVQSGLAAITAAVDSGYVMDMPSTPIQDGAATVAQVLVTDGEQILPTNISFTDDIIPIFRGRGCAACHSGNGDGKDLANLTLDGGGNKIYRELMDTPTNPGLRIDLTTPEDSLVLRMPSAEDPPDGHPTVVFASPNDADYLKLLVWIQEGALQN